MSISTCFLHTSRRVKDFRSTSRFFGTDSCANLLHWWSKRPVWFLGLFFLFLESFSLDYPTRSTIDHAAMKTKDGIFSSIINFFLTLSVCWPPTEKWLSVKTSTVLQKKEKIEEKKRRWEKKRKKKVKERKTKGVNECPIGRCDNQLIEEFFEGATSL